jgi:hypothetical protein
MQLIGLNPFVLKVIATLCLCLRLVILLSLLTLFTMNFIYFISLKNFLMQTQGLSGFTKFNYAVIFAIGLVIFLRYIFNTVINYITIYLIITYSVGDDASKPFIWELFRGIIQPIINITELCLISYMICH